MKPPIFATVTLDTSGGGVATVSRLIWQVLQEEWNGQARLVTLSGSSERSAIGARLAFGARLAAHQLQGNYGWVMCGHISAAQAQRYVPGPVRRPYGLFLHGIEAWRPMTASRRAAVEGASLLLSNSHYTARRVAAMHPWIGEIVVCPLAAMADATAGPAPAGGPVPDLGPLAVLVVARMDPDERYKGHDQLLEAWPRVIAGVPSARLVFAGGGRDGDRLRLKAEGLRLGDSVQFTGFVPEAVLGRLYGQAALFAMPSRDEGFGLVYLEAMRHSLCCIGSTHDAAGEVIEDGVTGVLVDQGRTNDLADSMIALLQDEPRRRAMGARGRLRAEQQFGFDRFRERFLSVTNRSFGVSPTQLTA